MLRHEPRNEVVHFPLPACDSHAAIVGEWKANVKDFRRQARPESATFRGENAKGGFDEGSPRARPTLKLSLHFGR